LKIRKILSKSHRGEWEKIRRKKRKGCPRATWIYSKFEYILCTNIICSYAIGILSFLLSSILLCCYILLCLILLCTLWMF